MTQLLDPTGAHRVTAPTRPHPVRRRVTGLVAGVALVLGAIGLIAAGASAAFVRSNGDFVDLGAHGTYRTDGYALATSGTDWRDTLLGFAGAVRVQVTAVDHQPIFVGVAPPHELRRYLAGVESTTVQERDGGVVRQEHVGTRPAVPAGDAVAWTAHAEGTATQTVQWDATDGRQAVVAMRADGSRPVHVRIVSSAVTLDRMPWWLPAGALALGVALLAAGVVVVRTAVRTRRTGE